MIDEIGAVIGLSLVTVIMMRKIITLFKNLHSED